MNIQHFEKHFHYTDRELLHIARKVGKLATYCKRLKNDDSFIRVEAEYRKTEKKTDSFKVMITVELPDKTLRAESRRAQPTEAVDRCIEKLDPQVKKYKELHSGVHRMRRGQKNGTRKRQAA